MRGRALFVAAGITPGRDEESRDIGALENPGPGPQRLQHTSRSGKQIELSEELRDIGPLEKPGPGPRRLQHASRSGKFAKVEQRCSVRPRQGGGATFASNPIKSINFLDDLAVKTKAR